MVIALTDGTYVRFTSNEDGTVRIEKLQGNTRTPAVLEDFGCIVADGVPMVTAFFDGLAQ